MRTQSTLAGESGTGSGIHQVCFTTSSPCPGKVDRAARVLDFVSDDSRYDLLYKGGYHYKTSGVTTLKDSLQARSSSTERDSVTSSIRHW